MRWTILPASLAAALAVTSSLSLAADPRLDGIKQIERNACVRLGNTGPGAPKNLKLAPKYCECVARTYWDNIPPAEIEEVMNNGQSAAVDKRREERITQARAACQLK